ncbi:MAG: beta-N-acetylhexosaminidase [Oscillospiraceae bacterium]
MKLCLQGSIAEYKKGLEQIASVLDVELCESGIPIKVTVGEKFSVKYQKGKGEICAANRVQFFRGIGLLCEYAQKSQDLEQTSQPVFEKLAASFDMSRNGVLTVDTLKKLLCRMALMGYTQVMLYTEETYEVEKYPFFGYMRGRYTHSELKLLDDYAYALGIELVPCIQTLGHLERFLHWQSSAEYRDTNDVLLAGDDKTYALIDAMFASARECYRTDKIHVGMDEAMSLGLGAYLSHNGYESSFDIMQKHIKRVCNIAQKYGFVPMMWSDMYFRCASKTHDYYEDDIEIPQNVIDAAPQQMELVYWDYYHGDKAFYDHYIQMHQKFAANTWFAGGMWTWLGPAIDYDVFFKTSLPALQACVENGIKDVMITSWGDDGAETNVLAMQLGLQVYAEYCYMGKYDEAQVSERLAFCTGGSMAALRRIAAFNKTDILDKKSDLPNGAKFLLYQDPMLGLYDVDIEGMGFAKQYKTLEKEFAQLAQTAQEYAALYNFYACLAGLLKDKAELGIGIYRAYQRDDKKELARFGKMALRAAKACKPLKKAWSVLWLSTNKAFGFEIIDVRLCGVAGRLNSTAQRIDDYCSGRIDKLEEMEEERLHLLREENTNILNGVYFWKHIVSAACAF